MKTTVLVSNYNQLEFSEQEIKELELLINNQTKPDERVKGMVFVKKRIAFVLEGIAVDFDRDEKIYSIKQLTTNQKIKTA